MTPMPIIKLSNGLLVGNLTSGHTFEFEDGSILDACQSDRVEAGKMNIVEREYLLMLRRANHVIEPLAIPYTTIEIRPELTEACKSMLNDADKLYLNSEVHLVIVPLMMLEAIKRLRRNDPICAYWEFAVVIRKNGCSCLATWVDRHNAPKGYYRLQVE